MTILIVVSVLIVSVLVIVLVVVLVIVVLVFLRRFFDDFRIGDEELDEWFGRHLGKLNWLFVGESYLQFTLDDCVTPFLPVIRQRN